jgi:hypothetical protein
VPWRIHLEMTTLLHAAVDCDVTFFTFFGVPKSMVVCLNEELAGGALHRFAMSQ